MEQKSTNTRLISYINSLEITKVSFGKLFITDPQGRLAIEVTSKGKNAFVNKSRFALFSTNEAELEILIKERFKDETINYVMYDE